MNVSQSIDHRATRRGVAYKIQCTKTKTCLGFAVSMGAVLLAVANVLY